MTTVASSSDAPRNRTRTLILIGCGLLLLFACLIAAAVGGYFLLRDRLRADQEPAVAYILDTSPRMGQSSEEGIRLNVARAVLAEIVRPSSGDLTAGLRVFGSGATPQSCEDTELVVPYAPANQNAIAQELLGLNVGGSAESALAEAMVEAIRDLQAAVGPHSIVVVTGGADSCNPQAGELVAREAEQSGIDLDTYVIGFQVSPEEAAALKTFTEAVPGGEYYDAADAEALRAILDRIQRQIEAPLVVAEAVPTTAAGEGPSDGPDEAESGAEVEPPSEFGDYESQTACDHPFFPMRQGASWSYTSNGFGFTWTVNAVTGDLDSAVASVSMAFDTGAMSYEWSCGAEGVFYQQMATFTAQGQGAVMDMQITSQSGAPLLAASSFVPGATWTSSYTVTSESLVAGAGGTFTSEVQESHTAGERQTLSTELGSFEVIPVTSQATSSMSSDFGTFTGSWTSTCWYGYGVGLLRCETSMEGGSSATELVGYSLP